MTWVEVETIENAAGSTRVYLSSTVDGSLTALVNDLDGFHRLSIIGRDRNPTLDEIANARWKLLPADVGFVLMLPSRVRTERDNINGWFHVVPAGVVERVLV